MEKRLVQHGEHLALVIDPSILELLKIDSATKFELTTTGEAILITPLRDDSRRNSLKASLQKVNDEFGDDLRRLAE
jgi:hypothetical protein